MRFGDRRQRGAQPRPRERRQGGLDQQHVGCGDHQLGARQARQLGEHRPGAAHDGALGVEHFVVERALGAELGERREIESQRPQAASFSQSTSSRFGWRRTSARALTRAPP